MGLVMQGLYITVVATVTMPFQCKMQPSGQTTLTNHPDVTCGEGQHNGMLVQGSLFTCIYGVGWLAVTLWANRVAPRRSSASPAFLVVFRFLFFRFRADRWYWGAILLVRNLILSFVPVTTPDDSHAQMVLLSTVLLVGLAPQAALWPWKSNELNVVDMTLVCLAITTVACAAVSAPRSPNEGTFTVLMVLGFVLAMMVAIVPFCKWLYLVSRKDESLLQIPDGAMAEVRSCCRAVQDLNRDEVEDFLIQIGPFGRKAVRQLVTMAGHELSIPWIRASKKTQLTLAATRQSGLRTRGTRRLPDLPAACPKQSGEVQGASGVCECQECRDKSSPAQRSPISGREASQDGSPCDMQSAPVEPWSLHMGKDDMAPFDMRSPVAVPRAPHDEV
mmetsp:Transcript_74447/g.170758  ORF Transcript_74447/g.170758 Transcript_74447/m.170758 type:complete len:389 (+) Transcript_74447:3-1169(+)